MKTFSQFIVKANEILESRGQDLRDKHGITKPGQASSKLADKAYSIKHRDFNLARNAEDRSQGRMPHGLYHDGTRGHRNYKTGKIDKNAVHSRGGAPLGSDRSRSNPSAEKDRGRTTHANFKPLTPQRRTEIRRMKTRKPGEGSVPKGNKHYRQFVSGVSQKDDPMDILKSASK
jgi:hypothetical protein